MLNASNACVMILFNPITKNVLIITIVVFNELKFLYVMKLKLKGSKRVMDNS